MIVAMLVHQRFMLDRPQHHTLDQADRAQSSEREPEQLGVFGPGTPTAATGSVDQLNTFHLVDLPA
ncbi:hypothetical protein J2W56_004959 [Nocardia kruczakiae]|uniref:Uncharacterized protein n=1 Tax=Nocardia kruczakiae TaxID=261477 RepID=A0ABU1XKV8_9NOCA|nr:hypothetical protein [Nocardia kruczakiae]